MDCKKIKKLFEDLGYITEIENFAEVNFNLIDKYKNSFILYQSSEDPDLRYKDYIEDIILGLKNIGAVLIPKFEYFRAHHNKVFMEILRDISNIDIIKNIKSQKFGTYEEFLRLNNKYNIKQDDIVKISSGSRSVNVFKLNKYLFLKWKLFSFSLFNIKIYIKHIFDKKPYTFISNYRKKFIVQNNIGNLSGDYKVVIYGNKFYVLFRKNRKNDFRASGSGLIQHVENVNTELLNYAKKIKDNFNIPYISLDIAFNGKKYYLIEFQFLMFGNFALEKSNFYFTIKDNKWVKEISKSNLENEFVSSVHEYIKLNY